MKDRASSEAIGSIARARPGVGVAVAVAVAVGVGVRRPMAGEPRALDAVSGAASGGPRSGRAGRPPRDEASSGARPPRRRRGFGRGSRRRPRRRRGRRARTPRTGRRRVEPRAASLGSRARGGRSAGFLRRLREVALERLDALDAPREVHEAREREDASRALGRRRPRRRRRCFPPDPDPDPDPSDRRCGAGEDGPLLAPLRRHTRFAVATAAVSLSDAASGTARLRIVAGRPSPAGSSPADPHRQGASYDPSPSNATAIGRSPARTWDAAAGFAEGFGFGSSPAEGFAGIPDALRRARHGALLLVALREEIEPRARPVRGRPENQPLLKRPRARRARFSPPVVRLHQRRDVPSLPKASRAEATRGAPEDTRRVKTPKRPDATARRAPRRIVPRRPPPPHRRRRRRRADLAARRERARGARARQTRPLVREARVLHRGRGLARKPPRVPGPVRPVGSLYARCEERSRAGRRSRVSSRRRRRETIGDDRENSDANAREGVERSSRSNDARREYPDGWVAAPSPPRKENGRLEPRREEDEKSLHVTPSSSEAKKNLGRRPMRATEAPTEAPPPPRPRGSDPRPTRRRARTRCRTRGTGGPRRGTRTSTERPSRRRERTRTPRGAG